MTEEQFDAVAAKLRDILAQAGDDPFRRVGIYRVGDGLAELFEQWFPGFQRERFRRAAGLPQ